MILETGRLFIRPFLRSDLLVIQRISDEAFGATANSEFLATMGERRSWLEWQILSQEWFPKLRQPPYGDLAISLKTSNHHRLSWLCSIALPL